MNVISIATARLGEARHLFLIGASLAAIGASCTMASVLLRPAPRQGNDQGRALHLLPYHSYPGLVSPPDCYVEAATVCRLHLTESSSLHKLAKTLDVTTRELLRLNPSATNRLVARSSVVVRACIVVGAETCARSHAGRTKVGKRTRG
jgi:hypothetical protein